MNEKKVTYVLMCLLICIWGMDYVVANNVLELFSPLTLVFFRYLIAMTFIFIVKLIADREFVLRKKDLPLFIICSIVGQIIYNCCKYSSIEYIPVSLMTIILTLVPVLSIITERVLYKRKFNGKVVFGVLMCIVGCIMVLGADLNMLFSGHVIGYILAFGAAFTYNVYNYMTATIGQRYSGLTMTFNQLVCTALLMSPYAVTHMPDFHTFTPLAAGSLIYIGIFGAGIGILIIVKGLKVLGPTVTSMFSNFLPVSTTIFGFLFLGQTIEGLQIVGGVIIIISACIVIYEKYHQ